MCKFRKSIAELKPSFEMIDTIQGQLEDFNKSMADFDVRFTGIEVGQSRLDMKLDNYNQTLSEDISKTISMAEEVRIMADALSEKQTEIVENTASKLSALEQEVDEKLLSLSQEQQSRFESLMKQQETLSAAVASVQENVTTGQQEMMQAINTMDGEITKQSGDMQQKLNELRNGLASLKEQVDKQVKDMESSFETTLSSSKKEIEDSIQTLKRHIEETDDFMGKISEVHTLLDTQFQETKKMIEETDTRVKELDAKSESRRSSDNQTLVYVSKTLDNFRHDIQRDESSMRKLKIATYTILSLLFVAVLLQYAFIFRHKLARFNPSNRMANIDS